MDLIKTIENKINNKEIYRIIFYGPSTTNMQSVFPNWPEIIRYVLREHLEKITGDWKFPDWYIQTANRALDGATSKDLLANCEEFVLKEKPDLVFLSVSKNDAYLNIDLKETEINTRKFMEVLLKNKIAVVFTTSAPSKEKRISVKIMPFVESDRKVARLYKQEENFEFIDFFQLIPASITEKMYSFISDGNEKLGFKPGDIDTVHFNRYGNAVIAGTVLKECFGANFDADKFLADLKDETKMHPRF